MAAQQVRKENDKSNMSIYKRGRIYWCEWEISGRRVRESSGTPDRQAAQEYHDQRRAELWRQDKLGEVRLRWDDAALAWWKEHAQHKRSAEDDRLRLRWVTPHLKGRYIDQIGTAALTELRDKKRAEGVTASTANRHLAVVSAVLNYAHAREWLKAVPKIPYLKEPPGRLEWLTRDEVCRLIALLPLHLGAMTLFSVSTGLRRRNVTHLEWSQIDRDKRIAWIHPDQSKAGKPLAVPLNGAALAVLDLQNGQHPQWVFPWRSKPIRDPAQVAWKQAVAAIGRPGFEWHGLRHTWASWHVMAGTPLEVLQRLGGWASYEMVLRYAHLSPGYVAGYANRVSLTIFPTVGTPVG